MNTARGASDEDAKQGLRNRSSEDMRCSERACAGLLPEDTIDYLPTKIQSTHSQFRSRLGGFW